MFCLNGDLKDKSGFFLYLFIYYVFIFEQMNGLLYNIPITDFKVINSVLLHSDVFELLSYKRCMKEEKKIFTPSLQTLDEH